MMPSQERDHFFAGETGTAEDLLGRQHWSNPIAPDVGRVFQRRVEHAFVIWLGRQQRPSVALDYRETQTTGPIRQFLQDSAFTVTDGLLAADLSAFGPRIRRIWGFSISRPPVTSARQSPIDERGRRKSLFLVV